jgi:hypothetical protein
MPTRKSTSATTSTKKAKAGAKAASKPRKHVGDVLGISRARLPKGSSRATSDRGGNPKGIELSARRKRSRLKPARVRG